MDFLADDQLRGYGRFRGDLSQSQLDRFFLLDHVDRRMVERHRRDHQRLGFAMQLGTVRFLGTFLSDPLDVPWQVVECLAEQLRIRDSVVREALRGTCCDSACSRPGDPRGAGLPRVRGRGR